MPRAAARTAPPPTFAAATAARSAADHAALDRDDLAALLDVTQALAAPFELPTMLRAVADAARRVLHAERCSVWLHDAAHDELVLAAAADLTALRLPLGTGLVGLAARERRPVLVEDCYADPRFDPAVDRASGFRTRCCLALPLVDHEERLVGVLQCLNKTARDGTPAAFAPDDLALARTLAAQCALALARVRLTDSLLEGRRLHAELQAARRVQQATLPAGAPRLPGYAVHGLCLPAEETGGDTWDLAPAPADDGRWLLVMADAAGHGIAPALAVVQLQAMLRMALRLSADLPTAFREANDHLAESLPDDRFVTAFVGLLDPRTHRLQYLSGGHGPTLLWRAAAGRCERLAATAPPLGAMTLRRARPPVQVDLAPGDLLLLLTDGLHEQPDAAGRPLGLAAVESLLCAHAAAGPRALADALLAAWRAHAGRAAQDDDVTLLLVQRQDPPATGSPAGA